MTTILTWNIQCGLGVDGRVDLVRIADVIRSMTDADVICLQEVSRFNPELDGGENVDQAAALAALFPEYEPVFGAAIDRLGERAGERRQFGNMILSPHPILQIFRHQLPHPAPGSDCKHMPRQALEAVVAMDGTPLRITTTHLEFHSEVQRLAQGQELHRIHDGVVANRDYVRHAPPTGPYKAVARPVDAVLCGDFNAAPDDPVYDVLLRPVCGKDGDRYHDAWRIAHGETPHAPTCGIYDTKQWPQGPHCRDFLFVAGTPANRIREVRVNEETAASDHQPLVLVLDT